MHARTDHHELMCVVEYDRPSVNVNYSVTKLTDEGSSKNTHSLQIITSKIIK